MRPARTDRFSAPTPWVFGVAPTKVLAFAKGGFAQTRYRFAP